VRLKGTPLDRYSAIGVRATFSTFQVVSQVTTQLLRNAITIPVGLFGASDKSPIATFNT